MLHFVVGLPGGFAHWCTGVVFALASRSAKLGRVAEANTLADVSRAILSSDNQQLVISTSAPGGRLRAALMESNCPLAVVIDAPWLVCAELVLGAQCNVSAAVQRVASSCGAMTGFGSRAGTLVLEADRDWSDSEATAKLLADHFHLAVNERGIAAVLDEIGRGALALRSNGPERLWSQLGPAQQELVRGALDPYLENPTNPSSSAIWWSAELFFLGDRFDQRAALPIDITGRARCLLHGPYISLPSGNWSIAATLQVTREAAEQDFLIEVVTDRQLTSRTIRPHRDGRFEAELTFVIDDSSDAPVAMRLSTQRAAFDGLVTLSGARLLQHRAVLT